MQSARYYYGPEFDWEVVVVTKPGVGESVMLGGEFVCTDGCFGSWVCTGRAVNEHKAPTTAKKTCSTE